MPPKTQREREEAWRQAKLERMQEQIDDGSLTVRQMTDEEKAKFLRRRDDKRTAATPAQRDRATRARERRRRAKSA